MTIVASNEVAGKGKWTRRILLSVFIWSAIGCIFALPGLLAGENWKPQLLGTLAQWWSWGLMAPLIVEADKLLPFTNRQILRRIIAHIVLGPMFTVVYLYLFAAVLAVLGLQPWSRLAGANLLLNALGGMFFWSMLVYCLIVGVWQAQTYYLHYLRGELQMERLQRSYSEARLHALRMQLDPHFLFNALNTISSQVERDPRLARQMIQHLGDLLRMSLETKDRQEVLLAEEVTFLDPYLAIQKIRFGDRLEIVKRIDPEVRYALVPCLFLQPLVENAIRHGISGRASGGKIIVSAVKEDGLLKVCVVDDGVGLPTGWKMDTSSGLGLSVTRQRVLGLYPEGQSDLVLRRLPEGGTEACVILPLRTSDDMPPTHTGAGQ